MEDKKYVLSPSDFEDRYKDKIDKDVLDDIIGNVAYIAYMSSKIVEQIYLGAMKTIYDSINNLLIIFMLITIIIPFGIYFVYQYNTVLSMELGMAYAISNLFVLYLIRKKIKLLDFKEIDNE